MRKEENGWKEIERYFDRRFDKEIRLITLFIITISAQGVIASFTKYKLILIPVLINIVGIFYLAALLFVDLKSKEKKDVDFVKRTVEKIVYNFGEFELKT